MVVARNVTNSVPESKIICDGEVIDKKGTETIFLLYRGNCSKDYARALHKINAPCTIIMTLRKLKTVLSSRKPPVEKMLKTRLFIISRCSALRAMLVKPAEISSLASGSTSREQVQ